MYLITVDTDTPNFLAICSLVYPEVLSVDICAILAGLSELVALGIAICLTVYKASVERNRMSEVWT